MSYPYTKSVPNSLQLWSLFVLRIFIGWHFLYEGLIKLTGPGWSAESYLANTRGIFSGIFHAMASDPSVLKVVDLLNIWGLILIGTALMIGICARTAAIAGALLLIFYYIAYPPFMGFNFGATQEGHYLLIDKTFIELVALIVLVFSPHILAIGAGNLLKKLRLPSLFSFLRKKKPASTSAMAAGDATNRREMVRNLAFLPFIGGFAWAYTSEKKFTGADAFSGSTVTLNKESLSKIEGKMPLGVLVKGKPPVSRLILGTNHLSGTAHARDLIYASSLFRAYNTERKIIETYMLADQAGINLFYITPLLLRYKKMFNSGIQTWTNVAPTIKDPFSGVDKAIDNGADYIFIQGAACDRRVHDGETEAIAKCVEYIKKQGYPAGLGAHTIQAMIACVDAGIDPDFYYKTMHHDRYWSAHPKENRRPFLWSSDISEDHNKFHDNMWCLFPEETVAFIRKAQKPVVGFKVLAGGAIHPKDGFQWAFDNGADFIEVGMFDFQIVANVNQTIRSVDKAAKRIRPWFG